MTLLEQFKTAREVYISLINEQGDAIIKEIIKDLGIRYSGLTCGTIVGYTPSFNDGDTCEHFSQVEVQELNEYVLEEYFDMEDFEYNNLTSNDARDIEAELQLVDLILMEREGTNYQLGFIIIDGEVQFKTGYHDCGY